MKDSTVLESTHESPNILLFCNVKLKLTQTKKTANT